MGEALVNKISLQFTDPEGNMKDTGATRPEIITRHLNTRPGAVYSLRQVRLCADASLVLISVHIHLVHLCTREQPAAGAFCMPACCRKLGLCICTQSHAIFTPPRAPNTPFHVRRHTTNCFSCKCICVQCKQAKADIDSIYSTGLFEDINIVPKEAEESSERNPRVGCIGFGGRRVGFEGCPGVYWAVAAQYIHGGFWGTPCVLCPGQVDLAG